MNESNSNRWGRPLGVRIECNGDRLWVALLDVTNTPAIRTVVGKVFADLGKIDVIVNSAG